MKTGYTSEAKYCLAATAKRGDFRLIAVVMGEPDTKARNRDVSRMLDFAFSRYTNHVVYRKGEPIGEVRIGGGDPYKLLDTFAAAIEHPDEKGGESRGNSNEGFSGKA